MNPALRRAHTRTALVAVALAPLLVFSGTPGADAAETAVDCDPITTLRPDGVTGDASAIMVTSQVLEQGQTGWAAVGWVLDPAIDAPEVYVVSTDEVITRVRDDVVTAQDVLELRLCGVRPDGDDVPADDDSEQPTTEADAERPEPRDDHAPAAASELGGDTASTGDATSTADAHAAARTDGDAEGASGNGEPVTADTAALPATGPRDHLPALTGLGLALLGAGGALLATSARPVRRPAR